MRTVQDKYSLILQAIDFFSQSLHVDQLIDYGFAIVNDTLNLDESALFVEEQGYYVLKSVKGYPRVDLRIQKTPKHKEIATRVGRILTSELEGYFPDVLCETYDFTCVIPIIVKDELVGFILSKGCLDAAKSREEYAFAFAINQLVNKATESALNYRDLKEQNYALDKKIFHQFFINQSSKLLMSELNIDLLYDVCVDILRELTSSAVTSFFVYHPESDLFQMKSYKNTLTFEQDYYEMTLTDPKKSPVKLTYHRHHDERQLEDLLGDLSPLDHLSAEYVTFVAKDHIEGFVTLSRPLNGKAYDKEVMEVVESIANSIFIAITNGRYVKNISLQRAKLDHQLNQLKAMQVMIKRIGSSDSLEEISDILMSTMVYGLGMSSCGVYLKEANDLKTYASSGVIKPINLKNYFNLNDEATVVYTQKGVHDLIPQAQDVLGDHNCLVLMPISLNELSLNHEHVLGYILVTQVDHVLTDSDVTLLQTIANALAPIIKHLTRSSYMAHAYIKNPKVQLMEELKEAEQDYQDYDIPYALEKTPVDDNPFDVEERGVQGLVIGGFSYAVVKGNDALTATQAMSRQEILEAQWANQ